MVSLTTLCVRVCVCVSSSAQLCNAIVENTKAAASTLFDPDLQAKLFAACRAVCEATADLVNQAKAVSDSPGDQAAVNTMNGGHKQFVEKVGAFVQTIKEVDAENSKGIRACEEACRRIRAALPELTSPAAPKVDATVDDMVNSARACVFVCVYCVAYAAVVRRLRPRRRWRPLPRRLCQPLVPRPRRCAWLPRRLRRPPSTSSRRARARRARMAIPKRRCVLCVPCSCTRFALTPA